MTGFKMADGERLDPEGIPGLDDDMLAQAIALSLDESQQANNDTKAQAGESETKSSGKEPRKLTDFGPSLLKGQPAARLFLEQLLEMGITENAAIKGLYYTDGRSVDEAASWVFDNMHLSDINQPLEIDSSSDSEDEAYAQDSGKKMVFVVNMELNMGVGKIAAQVGHAALGLYSKLTQEHDELGHQLMSWEDSGSMKIVLKGESTAHLLDLESLAKRLELPVYLVHDAGRTQIAAGSITVLSIFGAAEEVNKVTGKLRLL